MPPQFWILLKPCTISSVVRQKGDPQDGGIKKTKHAKFSRKRIFLPPDTQRYVSVSGGKKWVFFGKFGVFFL